MQPVLRLSTGLGPSCHLLFSLNARSFNSYTPLFARKSAGDSASNTGIPSIPLTGDLDVDGLTRFEIDFMETADWVKTSLLKMKHAKKDLAHLHKPFEPATPTKPICVKYTERYTYDFTRPPPVNNAVALQVRVADLGLTPPQKHKFLLLAGKAYDPYMDLVSMADSKGQSHSLSEDIDRALSLKQLSGYMDEMIAAAKDTTDSFTDVPVNLTHAKRPKGVRQTARNLEFPTTWLKQTSKTVQEN
ncbi:hypothetical protein BATDEDRAFT_86631 [Batrachochytrium dendrobatidis JAM81]|uniref:Small ribosomal subunit protein mS35 mitochondrial conserved domain-containing protein n=2 Tax=Batrachochytrium dendrobatidis TaxID=109871 RepID=F4NW47_BATDJ|nr:uncharacterized protein BATDEDRAFT_86631 [Batrachochytrium dendrobatidis JAM81]EGF82415.1 hypothetical protein BATDEDRAFT_86631 [Batrachochytrium dendrobatidis JAM81]KAJ8328184.1 28S ribosomal protein S35, mitochondrial [Batrachochytrium dendrobatidis]KAK5673249.1 28S ribosomal protein S35, mitochondrial [Batrachochytrium dendrobatidis]OAJ39696.1 hypothetical protein BDEG_23525 [Batrachochytrium dendrobatidis JEL423]|eukprot:XP_006676919.1 hypothetical protein BATDEDRAFT_86631 [Batrachochytrium dendrobatidis JAM81]